MDIHWPVQGADQDGLVRSQGFMSSVDGLCLPVCPVDVLLKQSHCKDVGDILNQNYRGTKKNKLVTTAGKVHDTPTELLRVLLVCLLVPSRLAKAM